RTAARARAGVHQRDARRGISEDPHGGRGGPADEHRRPRARRHAEGRLRAGLGARREGAQRLGRALGQGDGRLSYLDVRAVAKSFRDTPVIQDLDLEVRAGEFVSLLGPSGCGKTTLLRIIAGLLAADRGRVTLDGADITRVPAHKRNVGVVFQSYALFPHLTVAENVAFGLRAHGVSASEIAATVARVLALVRLTDYGPRSIGVLSGGQQQR